MNIPTFTRSGQPSIEVPASSLKGGAVTTRTLEHRSCSRCGGSGRLPHYNFIQAGVCFKCNGASERMNFTVEVETKHYTAERLTTLNAAQDKRDAAKRAKLQAAAAAEIESKRGLMNRLIAIKDTVLTLGGRDNDKGNGGLAGDAATALLNAAAYGEINLASWVTENRVAALERSAARYAESQAQVANAPAIAEGKTEIEGTVTSTKVVESNFGYRPTYTLKMLVTADDGNKFWGTVPASLSEVAKGDRVKFSATVNPSDNDAHFAMFKRPTKASLVSLAHA